MMNELSWKCMNENENEVWEDRPEKGGFERECEVGRMRMEWRGSVYKGIRRER